MLRMGLPVLAPETSPLIAALAQIYGIAHVYETYLQAGIALAELPFATEALEILSANTMQAASFLNETASQESFQLSLNPN